MKQYFFFVILSICIFLQGMVTTAPLVLALLIAYTVSTRREDVFFLAFVSGVLIDILQMQSVGGTSIFLLCSVFLILLYQRKYEIASYQFILFASFFLSLIYIALFLHTAFVSQMLVTIMFAELAFFFLQHYFLHNKTAHKS